MAWIEFIISAFVVIVAGSRLTMAADRLSDQLNLGKAWIGIFLLGLVTSLPEAVSSVTAVRSLGADNLAVGNLLGSNNFNPLLLVMLDLVYRKGSVTNEVPANDSHRLSAYYAMVLTVIVIAEIAFGVLPHWGSVSIGVVAICALYGRGIFKLAAVSRGVEAPEAPSAGNLRQTWISIFISATLVVLAAVWLADAADRIAVQTGLGDTFVGSIFLALATSLPELIVTLSALQMGALDLGIGNVFGSNMVNILILAFCSLIDPRGPILYGVRHVHILTGLCSIVMVFIALKGIEQNKKKSYAGLGWDSWAMMAVFLTGSSLLYMWK